MSFDPKEVTPPFLNLYPVCITSYIDAMGQSTVVFPPDTELRPFCDWYTEATMLDRVYHDLSPDFEEPF